LNLIKFFELIIALVLFKNRSLPVILMNNLFKFKKFSKHILKYFLIRMLELKFIVILVFISNIFLYICFGLNIFFKIIVAE